MRVAHLGGFDAANYGDQLFPLIFSRRMLPHAGVIHVSPTGREVPFGDATPSVALRRLRESSSDIDAIVIGGGNLIYTGATPLAVYDDGEQGPGLAYPSLWAGAAELAAEFQVPLAWNAPGVRRAFSDTGARLVCAAASLSESIAVRDAHSRDLLRSAGVTGTIECTIDTGIEVDALWTAEEIDAAYRGIFAERGMSVPKRSVAFHLNHRYGIDSPRSIARTLDRIARALGAVPLLLALGPCHGDDVFEERVSRFMSSSPLMLQGSAKLIEFTACIARADAFAGSSLHGVITACAFGTPATVVAVERPGAFRKFSGFLWQMGEPRRLCATWGEAESVLLDYAAQGRRLWAQWDEARERNDTHWERLIETCLTPLTSRARSAKRAVYRKCRVRLLSTYERLGLAGAALLDQSADAVTRARAVEAAKLERSCTAESMGINVAQHPSVDVIVCVHNALDDVQSCFESLSRTSKVAFRVIAVNDGSNADTTAYLRESVAAHPQWALCENETPMRYTMAANRALAVSTADYVILMNSDTIAPHGWLSKMIDCGERSQRIGLVGPLSNAASWQSVPAVHDDDGDWEVNALPDGLGVDGMAGLVSMFAARANPSVPFLNGFCLAIKRAVLNTIGFLDTRISPDGYAEEIDYAFRAADAGYTLVVEDSAYVYHAKSRSYGHDMRRRFARQGKARLLERYGAARVNAAIAVMRDHVVLASIRARLQDALDALSRVRGAERGVAGE